MGDTLGEGEQNTLWFQQESSAAQLGEVLLALQLTQARGMGLS